MARWLIAIVAGVCLTAHAAAGGSAGPYWPTEAQKAGAWLQEVVGISPDRIVLLAPNVLVALKAIEPRPPSNYYVIVHFENFRDSLEEPSSEQEFLVNCPSRRFHIDRIESFTESGGRGVQTTSFGSNDWSKALPGGQEDRIISAVCGPSKVVIAAAPPPSAAPRLDAARMPGRAMSIITATEIKERMPARQGAVHRVVRPVMFPPIRTKRLG